GSLGMMRFDWRSGVFIAEIRFTHNPSPTDIYIPKIWYPHGAEILVSSGTWEMTDERNNQVLRWTGANGGTGQITITPKDG
nr:hypothetical protein [Anaerolineae bacterium]